LLHLDFFVLSLIEFILFIKFFGTHTLSLSSFPRILPVFVNSWKIDCSQNFSSANSSITWQSCEPYRKFSISRLNDLSSSLSRLD